MERLLTPDDVAELLGLQRDYVVKQTREGNIPTLKSARHGDFGARRLKSGWR